MARLTLLVASLLLLCSLAAGTPFYDLQSPIPVMGTGSLASIFDASSKLPSINRTGIISGDTFKFVFAGQLDVDSLLIAKRFALSLNKTIILDTGEFDNNL